MKKITLLMVLLVAVAAGGYYWYQQQSSDELPEGIFSSNGRLEMARFDIATLYPGRVERILVEEGEDVEKDQILVELSSSQTNNQVKAAQAMQQRALEQVEQAKAGRKQAEQSVARAKAEIKAREEQRKVAKMELDNATKMRRERLVSTAEVEKREAAYQGAVSAVEAAKAARDEAQAAVENVDAKIAEARAGVDQAKAQQSAAESQNEDMQIRSPKSGRIEYRIAEVGSVVGAGNKVISILDTQDVYMNIFLPNKQMSPLKVGDEARIIIDGLDNVWPANISFIATDAQFTPKSVETQNEREKLMFKVRLRIPTEVASKYKRLLKGGMTGNGYVKTEDEANWPPELAVKLDEHNPS